MMRLYTLLSRLLDYPKQALLDHLDEIRGLIVKDHGLNEEEKQAVDKFLDWMQSKSLTELQIDYVQNFDMVPEHSLHLTHHLFGDDRGRGPALVDLGEHFKQHGLAAIDGELPDFLPLLLEYVSTLDELQAQVFLGDAVKVLSVLAANLEKSLSPYAPLIRIIESRGHLARNAA